MLLDLQKSAQRARRPLLLAAAAAILSIGLIGCEKPADKAYRERYAKAEALFKERCKTAGVVIRRTVKDVEGIELAKVRQPVPWGGKEYFDQSWPEAAMAGEVKGDDYIKQFLVSEFINPTQPDRRGTLGPPTIEKLQTQQNIKKGYAFVEYIDDIDGQRFRCKPDWSRDHPNWVEGQHHCAPVENSNARYALDYENLVDPTDRQLWIAGTRLKVTDKQTGEVIAQLTRYVWDSGFGVSTTGRWPWQYANAAASSCPSDANQFAHHETRYFIDQVLIPKQGD